MVNMKFINDSHEEIPKYQKLSKQLINELKEKINLLSASKYQNLKEQFINKKDSIYSTNNMSKNIIVYDFGKKNLDMTLINIKDGIFSVTAKAGNNMICGNDFDVRLMHFCIQKFKIQNNLEMEVINLTDLSIKTLKQSCEIAKKLLSTSIETHIATNDFYNNIDLFIHITRNDFEKICLDLFFVCMKPIENILHLCNQSVDDIDKIILIGGMTRIPKIKKLVEMKFGKKTICNMDTEESHTAFMMHLKLRE